MGDATVIGRRDALVQRRPCHQADAVVRPSGGLKVIPSLEGGRDGTGPLLLPLSLHRSQAGIVLAPAVPRCDVFHRFLAYQTQSLFSETGRTVFIRGTH